MELLWQNASPNSTFAAQTLAIDCSAYDEIEIRCRTWSETPNHSLAPIRLKVGEYGAVTYTAGTASNWTGNLTCGARVFVNNGTSVTVHIGRYLSGYNASWTDKANAIIPDKIYGIKGLR